MPVISPNAFAPPAANDAAAAVSPALRERVRRLERAHSAQRAGRDVVPLGIPAIDALIGEGVRVSAETLLALDRLDRLIVAASTTKRDYDAPQR